MTKTALRFEVREFAQVGCFKIGSKVVRGNGTKVLTITAIRSINGGEPRAKLNGGVFYSLSEISLAGPNGDGVGV